MNGMVKYLSFGFITLFFLTISYAQNKAGIDQTKIAIAERIKKDIQILASDSLEGREAGTKGEIMAKDYIVSQFEKMGLTPFFNKQTSYIQSFDVNGGAEFGINLLKINGNLFKRNKDFYPMGFSFNGSVVAQVINVGYGIQAIDLNYDDYKNFPEIKGKIVVMELYLPDSLAAINSFFNYQNPEVRAKIAMEKGAAAVIFKNASPTKPNPSKILSNNNIPIAIPVIFVEKNVAKIISLNKNINAEIIVDIKREKSKTAYNVGGYINNNATYNVVIGAHYDHLGYTLTPNGKKIFYNGADDNASGTAAILELASYFKDTIKENYNLIFIAFSAEEKGLYGSEYFVESEEANLSDIAFMINCDMIGRLDSIKKQLTIYAVGSSPAWKKIIETTDKQGLSIIEKIQVGSGSDHYNFYTKNIPVVFFFTELHGDYHKTTDDSWKINYNGEAEIIKYIERFFETIQGNKKLPFQRSNIY